MIIMVLWSYQFILLQLLNHCSSIYIRKWFSSKFGRCCYRWVFCWRLTDTRTTFSLYIQRFRFSHWNITPKVPMTLTRSVILPHIHVPNLFCIKLEVSICYMRNGSHFGFLCPEGEALVRLVVMPI